MSRKSDTARTAASLAASLGSIAEARIAARRRDIATAEQIEARAALRAIIRRMSHRPAGFLAGGRN